ncbi:hypothetical protein NQZ68_020763 [Dissostichus eleginoides]|nr:hypothetical protein NQZ68_020763 [Dissostichus eleginoides]
MRQGTAEEKGESALCGPPSSLPLSSTTLFSTSSQTYDALHSCTLKPTAFYPPAGQEHAGRNCYIIQP